MAYGEPRATLDIDVVVTLDPGSVAHLLELFPSPDFYLSAERVHQVIGVGGSFKVIHLDSGFKIDFFVVSDPIEERQIAQRLRKPVLPDLEGFFSPPEELILKKLQYCRDGGSGKHLRDIRSMLAISPEEIDTELVEDLVRRFQLEAEWLTVRGSPEGEAPPPPAGSG